jgi:hypothetical protein
MELTTFLKRLAAVLLLAALVQHLTSCATTAADLPVRLTIPVDSSLQQQAAEQRGRALLGKLSTGKVKFKGPVSIQLGGTGNTSTATDARKAKAPVAAAPNAVATETKASHGPPWYVYGGLVVLGLAGGWLLRKQL